MFTFLGRKRELKALEDLYAKRGVHMAVIYGRRRVGKSTLIREFIKDKRAIFYTATKIGSQRNLELLGKQVTSVLSPGMGNITFPSLEDLLSYLTAYMGQEKLVFVIDELPYWAEKEEGLLSIFQKYFDNEWSSSNLLLILCGSTLSFMKKKVLSENSPLFGRRSIQIQLEPFDYLESSLFTPSFSYEDKAIAYGITGGVPLYLSLLDPDKSIDDNIKSLFFYNTGYLYDETRNLLAQEFEDIGTISAIIEQVARGENTLSLIADKVHASSQTVLYSLEKLISVGLVEKRCCIMEEQNKKKTQYILKDTLFQFWYAFIPEAISVIDLGRGDVYYDKVVKPKLHAFMGSIFEKMCRHYTLRQGINGLFGSFITKTGSWWGTEVIIDKDGHKRTQTADIDVVGLSPTEKSMVVGECKFRNEKIDKAVFETLVRRSHVISSHYLVSHYLLFSLAGFADWFVEEKPDMVSLFTLEDLYGNS